MSQSSPTGLLRGIRRWDLVALGVNFIVGAGIFGLPSRVYARAGTASIIAYFICAAVTLLIVLCFAEVGSRFTETGGAYFYAREAFGRLVGFEVGWFRCITGVLSFAANVNLLADYLSFIWPTMNVGMTRNLIIIIVTLAVTTTNVIGVRNTAIVSNTLAVGKLLPLILFIAVGLYYTNPQNFSARVIPGFSGISSSVLPLLYAFTGFDSLGIPAGEVRDPQRSVPFALLTTIIIVTLLYVLIQIVCIGTLPELATSIRPLADASGRFLGTRAGYIITAGAVVSIAGNLHGQMLVTPRVLFAMAEQRQLPKVFVVTHKRFRTPHISIIFSAIVILGLALSGTFIQLVLVSVMARLITYAATCAALPVLRRRGNRPPPAFKLPFGSVIAVAALAVCTWLILNSTKREAVIGAIAAAVGLVFCYLYRLKKLDGPGLDQSLR